MNIPNEFYVDKFAFTNGSGCSHVARDNVFDPGVRCYTADAADQYFLWGMIATAICSGLFALMIFWMSGRL